MRASRLSWAALALLGGGILMIRPDVTGYGVAMLVGIALSRAFTVLSVARARTAGFEMLWLAASPLVRGTRGQAIGLSAELRNRDTLPTYFRKLSVDHASGLTVTVHPKSGEVPAGGSLRLELTVTPQRVGLHGIFSITLHTIRAPGLFAIPLAFSNPLVLEVLPARGRHHVLSATGGRTRSLGQMAAQGTRKGDGLELYELREHRAGDPYKRIAWKASARRGKLLVIEREHEERDTVWVLLDASIDSASGPIGRTALDRGIDQALIQIDAHFSRGDRVGLIIAGARELVKVLPNRGSAQMARLITALSLQTHTADADRSDWDEHAVRSKVREHAASLDRNIAHLDLDDLGGLEGRVRSLLAQAPAQPKAPFSRSKQDCLFRTYLLAYGIQPPPRLLSDRSATESTLARSVLEVCRDKRHRASRLVFLGPALRDDTPVALTQSLLQARRRGVDVTFLPLFDLVRAGGDAHRTVQQELALDALFTREQTAHRNGMRALARAGIRFDAQRRRPRLLPRD